MTRTNAYSILVVMLRVAGLWLACGSLLKLPALLGTAPGGALWLGATLVAVQVLVGVLVWLYAESLARLAARPQQAVFESDLPMAHWQSLAISVVGLWQAVAGLSDVVYYGVGWSIVGRMIEAAAYDTALPEDIVGGMAAAVAQALVGIGLVVFSGGLARQLRHWREAGLPPAVE